MQLPTVLDTCEPRGDVLHGTIADADFAADLAKVIGGTASDDFKIPSCFFANTYPTQVPKNLPRNVLARLTGDSSATACIFRLDTRYVGGKPHELMPLTPAASDMRGDANVSEFIGPECVPRGESRIAALAGTIPLDGSCLLDLLPRLFRASLVTGLVPARASLTARIPRVPAQRVPVGHSPWRRHPDAV